MGWLPGTWATAIPAAPNTTPTAFKKAKCRIDHPRTKESISNVSLGNQRGKKSINLPLN
jgi:hypothetical protein